MNVPPRHHHAAARGGIRHDAGDGPVIRGRRQHHDGFAPIGHGRTADKIHLPADAAVKLESEGIRTHLPGEINGQRGIDGHHPVVLGDDIRIVHVLTRPEFKERIVVHIVIQAACAHAEGRDNLSRMQRLLPAGHDAAFNQIDEAVGKRFRVHAEVFFIGQIGENGIGNLADSRLNGGFIVDQIGNQPSDGLGDVIRRLLFEFQKRRVVFHKRGNLAHMDKTVAQRPRHVRIHLRHHIPGHGSRRLGDVHGNPQADIAVHVRRRDCNEGDINGHGSPLHQQGNFGKENGRVVGVPFLDGRAGVRADEERVVPEMLRVDFRRVVGEPQIQKVDHFHIGKVLPHIQKRFDQKLRLAAGGSNEDARAAPDSGQRASRVGESFLVGILPVENHIGYFP